MADREKEKVLCSFLASEIRDRVFYELGSSKKRESALSRFCHSTEQMIAATAVAERTRCSDICEWIKRIQTFTKAEQGYFIGFSSLDGTECPVEQALESGTASGMGFAVLIDDKVLFIREEQECGAPAAFLLRKNDKR